MILDLILAVLWSGGMSTVFLFLFLDDGEEG